MSGPQVGRTSHLLHKYDSLPITTESLRHLREGYGQ